MEGRNIRDLLLDSNEHCFFCLGSMSKVKLKREEFSIVSLQCLCRYLEMDLRKVLNGHDHTLSNSRLNVWLCWDCAILNRKIMKLYKEKEKIEMELKHNLNFIHGKLMGSAESNINPEVGILRTEALRKCSIKLNHISPRVRVQNQNIKAFRTINNIKLNSRITEDVSQEVIEEGYKCQSDRNSEAEEEMAPARKEYSTHDHIPVIIKLERKEDLDLLVGNTLNCEIPHDMAEFGVTPTPLKRIKITSKLAIPARELMAVKPGWTESCPEKAIKMYSKFNCTLCEKKYNSKQSLDRHSRVLHIGLRFRCLGCSKTFTRKHQLYVHQKLCPCNPTPLMPLKHFCHYANCGKGLSRLRDLRRHLKSHELKPLKPVKPLKPSKPSKPKKHDCTLCGKTLYSSSDLQRHFNSVHLQLRRHECKICRRKFNRKHHLQRHVRQLHA